MSPLAKLQFVFTCYDFSETNGLTLDETTLSLKSTLTGLLKLTTALSQSSSTPPSLSDFETFATLAFASAETAAGVPTHITANSFLSYLEASPIASGWIAAFDDAVTDDVVDSAPPPPARRARTSRPASRPPVEQVAPFLDVLEKSKPKLKKREAEAAAAEEAAAA